MSSITIYLFFNRLMLTLLNFKKVAIIYKYLYIINNKLYNKLSGG